ncbi:MAG: pseudouridine-5'-phosphate glycosidase [Egibacteraceae bacterium]
MTPLRVGDEVATALTEGRPVVALESTLVVHGLPRPGNLDVAHALEDTVRAEGAVPAMVGVIGGVPTVGLNAGELERLAVGGAVKLGVRDLAPAAAASRDGATTVASTAHLAALAGIRVFATGGLGGVHRDARETWDESADLVTLARVPVAVVCSGVKSVLDVPATLQRLETLGVPVVGYRTHRLPGFYIADSGCDLEWRIDTPADAARVIATHHALAGRGLIIANPPPPDAALDPQLHDEALASALAALAALATAYPSQTAPGKAATPFLLAHLHAATAGATVRVNTALALGNARLAAQIASAL